MWVGNISVLCLFLRMLLDCLASPCASPIVPYMSNAKATSMMIAAECSSAPRWRQMQRRLFSFWSSRQETKLSLTNRATHFCNMQWRCWPRKSVFPHICYHAEFGHSTLAYGHKLVGTQKIWVRYLWYDLWYFSHTIHERDGRCAVKSDHLTVLRVFLCFLPAMDRLSRNFATGCWQVENLLYGLSLYPERNGSKDITFWQCFRLINFWGKFHF